MIIKKKHITACVLIVLLSIAGYLNFKGEKSDKSSKPVSAQNSADGENGEAVLVSGTEDYFAKTKSERDVVRSKTCDMLNKTINNDKISEENKKKAEEKILQIAEDVDKESKCEALLRAKGYEKNIVFINEGSVTVTVGQRLSETDTAKINDIIFEQTGNNNVKIVEVK